MNRERFEQLLDAYGGDVRRWPADERAAAEAFAREYADAAAMLGEARKLDAMLDHASDAPRINPALTSRILAAAPQPRRSMGFDARAGWALAACAIMGVLLGYGGGLLAPAADADDSVFSAAFEAPYVADLGDEG